MRAHKNFTNVENQKWWYTTLVLLKVFDIIQILPHCVAFFVIFSHFSTKFNWKKKSRWLPSTRNLSRPSFISVHSSLSFAKLRQNCQHCYTSNAVRSFSTIHPKGICMPFQYHLEINLQVTNQTTSSRKKRSCASLSIWVYRDTPWRATPSASSMTLPLRAKATIQTWWNLKHLRLGIRSWP